MERPKQITTALVQQTLDRAVLRVTLLADESLVLANTLVSAISASKVLRLGKFTCVVEAVDLADPKWGGISNWSEFIATDAATRLHFQFVTPTAIAKDGRNEGRLVRHFTLLPEPVDVFCGLAWRWHRFGGPPLPYGLRRFIEAGWCVVDRHDLHTASFETPNRTQIGFLGDIEYRCDTTDSTYVPALTALARFAHFSGVGYQTARGMGAVQVSIRH
jgi:CRISPR-associated endoribonuclease Cas6